MRNSFCHRGLGLLHANGANQFLQALTFRVEDTAAEGCQAVIAAPRVVQSRRWPFVGGFDQFRFDEALDRAIESRRPQAHLAGGAIQDVLHDCVAVLLTACEREHNVEPLGLEWEEDLRINLSHVDIYIRLYLYMSIASINGLPFRPLRMRKHHSYRRATRGSV